VAPFGIKVLIVEPGAFRTSFAADALKHMPDMDAYREIVGGTRDFARRMDGTQDGDPYKAARAIDMALRAETPPLRLQLGADSVAAIRAHSEQLLKDLTRWEKVAMEHRLTVRPSGLTSRAVLSIPERTVLFPFEATMPAVDHDRENALFRFRLVSLRSSRPRSRGSSPN
jgi:hypothetical protein